MESMIEMRLKHVCQSMFLFKYDDTLIWSPPACPSSMAGILEKFPLPGGSAAGELVASGIQQRCSLTEREVRRKEDVFATQTDVQLQSPL